MHRAGRSVFAACQVVDGKGQADQSRGELRLSKAFGAKGSIFESAIYIPIHLHTHPWWHTAMALLLGRRDLDHVIDA